VIEFPGTAAGRAQATAHLSAAMTRDRLLTGQKPYFRMLTRAIGGLPSPNSNRDADDRTFSIRSRALYDVTRAAEPSESDTRS
jgi:hypothetical protein